LELYLVRIALGQLNATVGDLGGNVDKMIRTYKQARQQDTDLIVFPELAVCGYPPEDLVYKQQFLIDNKIAVESLGRECPDKTIIVGFAEHLSGHHHNSAGVIQAGKITNTYRKSMLPNYGVFDERRYFQPGNKPLIISVGDINIAVTICFDIWNLDWLTEFLADTGNFDIILNISASPFHIGKITARRVMLAECAKQFNCAVVYCNLVGGQDELIFDGRSMLVNSKGKIITTAKAFKEDLLIADIIKDANGAIIIEPTDIPAQQPRNELDETYDALVLGTRDYTHKNGFKKVLLGLSGGIDSSVTAVIAADALGPENVIGITMPSKFNTKETISDAEKLAKNLGIKFYTIPIEPMLSDFHKRLSTIPGWSDEGVAYENLQARIRACILMSLSNQHGALVLTTGNKSETAVGYSTLYGDTAGGFGIIKDVPKTQIYKLAEHINNLHGKEIIPADVISRPPSAELRAGQKDSDSLPEYELLDEILHGYVEEDKSARDLINEGLDKEVVRKVIRMVDRNEYKRRLSPPGIKITPKAFGKDRRLPITNRYNP
jgi:NAD+ synthase (glutamine-hydrolysing)